MPLVPWASYGLSPVNQVFDVVGGNPGELYRQKNGEAERLAVFMSVGGQSSR